MSQATILIRKTTDIPSIEETSRRIHALIDMISEDFAIKGKKGEEKGKGKGIDKRVIKLFIQEIRSYAVDFEAKESTQEYKEIADNLECVVRKVRRMSKENMKQFETAVKNWISKMRELYTGKDLEGNAIHTRRITTDQYINMRERMFFILFRQLGTAEFRKESHLTKVRKELVEAMKASRK